MHISLILAHPNPGSFNHAIAEAAADELRRSGHEATLHDLCREQFPPDLTAVELKPGAVLEPMIATH